MQRSRFWTINTVFFFFFHEFSDFTGRTDEYRYVIAREISLIEIGDCSRSFFLGQGNSTIHGIGIVNNYTRMTLSRQHFTTSCSAMSSVQLSAMIKYSRVITQLQQWKEKRKKQKNWFRSHVHIRVTKTLSKKTGITGGILI